MASLDTGGGDSGHKKGPGVKKAKKLNTRVDMTPFVDIGFLLITFFIFTATMSNPTTMDLNMPKDTKNEDEKTDVAMSGALTILIGKDNKVYWYEGDHILPDGSNLKEANLKTIRDQIIRKKKEVVDAYVPDAACEAEARQKGKSIDDCKQKKFFVLIKPTDESTYGDVADLLDEMLINKVSRYAIIKPFDEELTALKLSGGYSGTASTATPAPAAASN